MLNAIVKLFQKSVQTRFLKLLGMLSTACKYRYQNIKKHSTFRNFGPLYKLKYFAVFGRYICLVISSKQK